MKTRTDNTIKYLHKQLEFRCFVGGCSIAGISAALYKIHALKDKNNGNYLLKAETSGGKTVVRISDITEEPELCYAILTPAQYETLLENYNGLTDNAAMLHHVLKFLGVN